MSPDPSTASGKKLHPADQAEFLLVLDEITGEAAEGSGEEFFEADTGRDLPPESADIQSMNLPLQLIGCLQTVRYAPAGVNEPAAEVPDARTSICYIQSMTENLTGHQIKGPTPLPDRRPDQPSQPFPGVMAQHPESTRKPMIAGVARQDADSVPEDEPSAQPPPNARPPTAIPASNVLTTGHRRSNGPVETLTVPVPEILEQRLDAPVSPVRETPYIAARPLNPGAESTRAETRRISIFQSAEAGDNSPPLREKPERPPRLTEASPASQVSETQTAVIPLEPRVVAETTAALQILTRLEEIVTASPVIAGQDISRHSPQAVFPEEGMLSPVVRAVRLKLTPEELGEVEIILRRHGGAMKVIITFARREAAEVARNDMTLLEERLGAVLASGSSLPVVVMMQTSEQPSVQAQPLTQGEWQQNPGGAGPSGGHGAARDGRSPPGKQDTAIQPVHEREDDDSPAGPHSARGLVV